MKANKYLKTIADNVHALSGVCPSVMAHLGGEMGHCIWILEEEDEREE